MRVFLPVLFLLSLTALLSGCAPKDTDSSSIGAETPSSSLSSTPSSGGESSGTDGIYQKVTPQEAKARMDENEDAIILDVRTQEEYDGGHIPGAALLPLADIGSEPPALLPDFDAEILVYCRSGSRSKQAAERLLALGYTAVKDFGGIRDWPYDIVTD